jgi:integrase
VYLVRREGSRVVWHRLGRLAEGEAALWQAYKGLAEPQGRTVGGMMTLWLAEDHGLAKRTVQEYSRMLDRLRPVFGSMAANSVQHRHVAMYLEMRGNVAANREVSALSSVYEWAMRKGMVEHNPCRGVRRNKEKPRTRYIRDEEWQEALEKAPGYLSLLMEAAYLTGLRQGDLVRLTDDNLTQAGILLEEGKRGKRLLVRWSDELRRVVKEAVAHSKCEQVFTNAHGQRWRTWALQSAIRRQHWPFTFHDIRARAESDHASGLGLLSRYKRAREVEPTR